MFKRGGRGRGGFRGGRGGGGGNRSFSNRGNFDQGPPNRVIPLGYYTYSCENDLVVKVELEDVPYFNAPIYLENKEQIGKIDEIFGTVRDYSVTIKLQDNIHSKSFLPNQKLFIDPAKLLPIARFLPKPPKPKGPKKKGSSGGVGGPFLGNRSGGGSFRRGGNRGGGSAFNRGSRGGGGGGGSGRRGGGFKRSGGGGRW